MKISIDNLPLDITEEALKNVFAQIGEVASVKIRHDLLSKEPTRHGIVEMTLEVDGYRAINCFEGAAFKDRKIHVTETYPWFEKAKVAFEHFTDGHTMPTFSPMAAISRWQEQHKDH
jgi:RNA recognition motif-containing protein